MWKTTPALRQLAENIPVSTSEDDLSLHASAALREVNTKYVASVLNALSCIYCRNADGSIDAQALQNLKNQGSKSICGLVFKKGDIVWTCRQCAKDQTCVQCDKCFRNSDHTGHDVYFHKAGGGGGCCDCGDAEAWTECGNCSVHGQKDTDPGAAMDPTISLPPLLVKGLRAVMRGVMGVFSSYMVGYTRGFCGWDMNCYLSAKDAVSKSDQLTVFVHNDDAHTYHEVSDAFISCGFSSLAAAEMTEAVDMEGQRKVFRGTPEQIRPYFDALVQRGKLLVSIVPDEVTNLTPKIHGVMNWLTLIAQYHDGIRRVIVMQMLAPVADIPLGCNAFDITGVDNNNISNSNNSNNNREYLKGLQLAELFTDPSQFPLKIPYLDTLHRSLDTCDPVIAVSNVVSSSTTGAVASDASSVNAPNRMSHIAEITSAAVAAAVPVPAPVPESSAVSDIKAYPYPSEGYRYYKPFVHGHQFASNCLGLFTLCSPFLPKSLQKNLCESLIVTYQHDAIFKTAYGQILTLLFPSLHALYMRTIGTEKDSIFNTTVQMYTADSVVHCMSSKGVGQRYFSEGTAPVPVHITSMLVRCLIAALIDIKCLAKHSKVSPAAVAAGSVAGPTMTLLESHVLANRKLWKLFRSIEYTTTNPGFTAQVLGEQIDPTTVTDWLRACSIVQCLYKIKRLTTTHVAQETEHWQVAMNLILEMDSVSGHMIGNALFTTPSRVLHSSIHNAELSREHLGAVAATAFERSLDAVFVYFARTENDTVRMGSVTTKPIFNQHIVTYPAYLIMEVSSGYVSINIPLHRFAGKVVHFAANSGLDLSPLVTHCRSNPIATLALLDYPLQCLSFISQVYCDMWRRNGSSVANMAYNYQRVPLCRSLRDIDIAAVQMAGVGLGGDVLIALSMTRFEVMFPFPQPNIRQNGEHNGPMLGELLRLFIHIVSYVPVVLNQTRSASVSSPSSGSVTEEPVTTGKTVLPETWEGHSRALRREIIHIILGCRGAGLKVGIGAIQSKVKHLLGTDNFVSEAMVKAVIRDCCVQKVTGSSVSSSTNSGSGSSDREDDGEDEQLSTELFPVEYDYFDPEQHHLSAVERQAAVDYIREYRKKEAATMTGVAGANSSEAGSGNVNANAPAVSAPVLRRRRPVIHAIALPIPHPTFAAMRNDILFQPLFCSLLVKSVDACIDSPKLVDKSMNYIVGRAIHLVTLQLHCSASAAAALCWGDNIVAADTVTLSGSQLFFATAFDSVLQGNLDLSNNNNTGGSDNGSSTISLNDNDASSYSTEQRVCVQAYWKLFMTLMRLWDSQLMQHDEYYWEGLEWIFQEICERSTIANEYLTSTRAGLSFVTEKAIQEALKKEQAAKRKRAQQRMTSRISALASSFIVPDGFASSDDEEGDKSSGVGSGESGEESDLDQQGSDMPVLDDHENLCIICQERKPHSSIGSLGFLQPSTVVRQAMDQNPDCPELCRVYRVVSLDGCTVYSVPSTDGVTATDSSNSNISSSSNGSSNAVVAQLSQGEHVLSDHRVGVWCHITAPVTGWVTVYRYSSGVGGTADVTGNISLPGVKLPVLLPVTTLQHNVFGGARVHISSCGHMMHYGCYDAFYSGCLQKSLNHFATEEIMDVANNNIFCPMCKSISNILVPYTPNKVGRKLLPMGGEGVSGPVHGRITPLVDFVAPDVCFQCSPASATTTTAPVVGGPHQSEQSGDIPSRLRYNCSDCSSREFTLSIEAKQLSESCIERGFIVSTQASRDNYSDIVTWERSHLGVKVWSTKSLHALWSTVAYTLLSATCSDRWSTDSNTSVHSSSSSSSSSGICPETRRAIELTRTLLLTIRQAPAWFNAHDPELFSTSISGPLIKMLLPSRLSLCQRPKQSLVANISVTGVNPDELSPSSISESGSGSGRKYFRIIDANSVTPDDCADMLLHLPVPSVYSSSNSTGGTTNSNPCTTVYPSHLRVSCTMSLLQRVQARSAGATAATTASAGTTADFDLLDNPVVHPALLKPLLTQDLHTVAVALVGSSSSLTDAVYLLQLLCSARLCQVLIEPLCTGLISPASAHPPSAQASATQGSVSVSVAPSRDSSSGSQPHAPKKMRTDGSGSGSGSYFESISHGDSSKAVLNCTDAELLALFVDLRDILVARGGLMGPSDEPSLSLTLSDSDFDSHPHTCMPAGSHLLALVLDSWTPYLQFISALMHCVRTAHAPCSDSYTVPVSATMLAESIPTSANVLALLASMGIRGFHGTTSESISSTTGTEAATTAGHCEYDEFCRRLFHCAAGWADAYFRMYSNSPSDSGISSGGINADASDTDGSGDGTINRHTLREQLCSAPARLEEVYAPGDFIPKPSLSAANYRKAMRAAPLPKSCPGALTKAMAEVDMSDMAQQPVEANSHDDDADRREGSHQGSDTVVNSEEEGEEEEEFYVDQEYLHGYGYGGPIGHHQDSRESMNEQQHQEEEGSHYQDDDEYDGGAVDGYFGPEVYAEGAVQEVEDYDDEEEEEEGIEWEEESLGSMLGQELVGMGMDIGMGMGMEEGEEEGADGGGGDVGKEEVEGLSGEAVGDQCGNAVSISASGRGSRGRNKCVGLVLQHANRRQAALANASASADASSSSSASVSGIAAGGKTTGDLDAVGVDPMYNTVDACIGSMFNTSVVKGKAGASTSTSHTISCAHSRTPFQGSVSGTVVVHGLHGESLSCGYQDLSHMGLGLRHHLRLIELPTLYTSAYQQAKSPLGRAGPTLEDPAVCMVCGTLLNAGSRQNRVAAHMAALSPGDCTIHAEHCGGGVGVFFLVQKCCPLLIKGSRACYLPPIYLDQNGETSETLSQSKPMHLSRKRVRRLEELYVRHQLVRELFRVRASSDKVIRQNWY